MEHGTQRTSSFHSWPASFEELSPGKTVRAFGVDYVHIRHRGGGDLYVTRFGWPVAAHLLPENWYEDSWYCQHGERLPGASGAVYRVTTRPVDGCTIDIVVKFSRVAQDVPLWIPTTFPDDIPPEVIADARVNSPLEEFGLVMELRLGAFGPPGQRILTQRPLAIYAPPEEFPLWQLGRDESSFYAHGRRLAVDQEDAAKAIELDIRRLYVVLYAWVEGKDAQQAYEACEISTRDFEDLTPRVVAELKAKGFRVLDNKPKHFILRNRRSDSQPLRRHDQLVYALVDFEFLQRTHEHERAFKTARRDRYWRLRCSPCVARTPSLPSRLEHTTIFGVDYLFGSGPDGGKLWVVGRHADLFEYFLPDRWRRTRRVRLSPTSEVYRTRTRDNIHLVYRRSRVGTRPYVDPLTGWGKRIREYGYNSPFEEVTLAMRLRQMGVAVTSPLAVYRTAHLSTKAGYIRDEGRFAGHAGLDAPQGESEPVLSPQHDYYVLWDRFLGADALPPHHPVGGSPVVDLDRAVGLGLLDHAEVNDVLANTLERLAAVGVGHGDDFQADELMVFPILGGLRRDATNRVEVLLSIDALAAYEYNLLNDAAYEAVVAAMDRKLRAVDLEKLDLSGKDVLLSMDPDGRFFRGPHGSVSATLCNFELIRGLYRSIC